MSQLQTRILLCHSARSHNEELFMMGIRRYAVNRQDWEIGYILPHEVEDHLEDVLRKWRPDGILMLARAETVPSLMSRNDMPLVAVDPPHQCPPTVTTVRVDDAAVGRQAADFVLHKRFQQAAVVVKTPETPYSDIRRDAFLDRMQQAGVPVHEFQLRSNYSRPWQKNPELNEWLKQLPRPIGIFCVRDSFAQQICDHARRGGIRVPGDFSVLGAGNHEVLCESVRPRLSSIPVPVEALGYRAAAVLDQLIGLRASGEPVPHLHEELEPGEVVERQSTSLSAIPDPAIATAAHYLLENTLQGGSIQEAVQEAGLNRKSLERGFKRYLDTTPGQFMTEVRLDHARRLLSTTDLSMGEIAEACALTQNHFSYLFRTTLGLTPNAYRKRMRQMEL
jgi:LacI family transcriptional regulator